MRDTVSIYAATIGFDSTFPTKKSVQEGARGTTGAAAATLGSVRAATATLLGAGGDRNAARCGWRL